MILVYLVFLFLCLLLLVPLSFLQLLYVAQCQCCSSSPSSFSSLLILISLCQLIVNQLIRSIHSLLWCRVQLLLPASDPDPVSSFSLLFLLFLLLVPPLFLHLRQTLVNSLNAAQCSICCILLLIIYISHKKGSFYAVIN